MKDLGITHALIFFSNPFLTNYLFSRFHYSNVFSGFGCCVAMAARDGEGGGARGSEVWTEWQSFCLWRRKVYDVRFFVSSRVFLTASGKVSPLILHPTHRHTLAVWSACIPRLERLLLRVKAGLEAFISIGI